MKLLAIDTATEACSAALAIDDDILERYEVAPRRHAELILPMVQSLLDEARLEIADIDALAFGRGPGAFTGLRIAAGVVQGIAWAIDKPVVPVSTLAAMALGASREFDAANVLCAIDARMQEVYWGGYTINGSEVVEIVAECVVSPQTVPLPALPASGWLGAGSGWHSYHGALMARAAGQVDHVEGGCLPHAFDIARLGIQAFGRGETVPAHQAVPVYLRDQVADKG
jgi:tRNA threonylcarbamoyladenosine biosynthesis protein TsaB